MRLTAWLNTAPEVEHKGKGPAPKPLTRLESRRKAQGEDYAPTMPDVGNGARLLAYFYEVGPTAPGGMGPAVLSHQEIAAWSSLTGVCLTPWEAKTLRWLSREYLSEHHEAQDPKRPPPWTAAEVEHRLNVALDMRSAIAAMAK